MARRTALTGALLGVLGAWAAAPGGGTVCDAGTGTCSWLTVTVHENGKATGGVNATLDREECSAAQDVGELLSPVIGCGSADAPCKVFSEVATRLTTCGDLFNGQRVYLVEARRHFIFPAHEVGSRLHLTHLPLPTGEPIELEVVSDSPRVFRVYNFFTEAEADALVQTALGITEDSHRLKRSSTGATGYNVDTKRTSENAFDTNSEVAMQLKRRCFDMLGISPYDETYADGLQVLRYNASKAYISHLDWIDPVPDTDHDWNSGGNGTNRFATVLLYLTDVDEGGETVFPNARPVADHPYPDYVGLSRRDAMGKLDSAGLLTELPKPGWERGMAADCRTKLSIRPQKAMAVLFYSQQPSGEVDRMSLHGGCPVLKGTKWAANLWVWNGPRQGFLKKNADGTTSSSVPTPISATFEALDVTGTTLYYEDTPWGELKPGERFHVNTYEGHKWNVRKGSAILQTWVVTDRPSQRFVLTKEQVRPELW